VAWGVAPLRRRRASRRCAGAGGGGVGVVPGAGVEGLAVCEGSLVVSLLNKQKEEINREYFPPLIDLIFS